MECNVMNHAVCVNETVYDSVVEVPLEADIMLPDYCPDIVKILKCTLNACVKSAQAQGRTLQLEGMCSVNVLYLGEDNSGMSGSGQSALQLRSVDYKLPYSKSVDLKSEVGQVIVFVSADSSYCSCRAVSKRRVELRASVSHKLSVVSSGEEQVVADVAEDTQNPQGIQLRKKTMQQDAFVTQARETISVHEELELAQGKPPVRSVICSNGCAVMTDRKLISGKIVTKGELRLQILYCTDQNSIEQMEYALPISAVIDAPGADDGCVCSAGYAVCELEILPKLGEDGQNTRFELNAQVVATAEVCRRTEIAVADDCYSTRYACEGHNRPLSFLSLLQQVEEKCLYKGEIELPDGVDSIIAGWGRVTDSAVSFEEENGEYKAQLHLSLNLCMLAYDDSAGIQFYDKTEKLDCSFPVSGMDAQEQRLLFCPQLTVTGFDYSRSAGALQVRCEVLVRGCICQLKKCSVMEEIVVDEQKPIEREDDCSLTIYYADPGENLWEIAKAYHTAMQSVLEANSQLELSQEDAVSKREMLLIPILSN